LEAFKLTEKKLVLVIEDNKKQNELICNIVERAGFQHVAAYDGIEGFDQLRKYRRGFGFLTNKIDCILLDLNMEKMTGLEFLELLRREESWHVFRRHIPVVVITAHDLDINREKASNPFLGMACEFIVKPFDEAQLKDIMIRIIEYKEVETLIEFNRVRRYKPYQIEEESNKNLRHAYFQGEISTDALEYLRRCKKEAEIDFDTALKSAIPHETIFQFQMIKTFFTDEYNKMLEKFEAKFNK